MIGCPIPWLACLYVASSLTLLVAMAYSFMSIRARSDWRSLKDADIFNAKEIEEGINPYRRYMAVHAWKIFQNNFTINNKKADYLTVAQQLFIFALMQLLPIILIIGLYSLKKGGYC